jgi:SAM-dependent methyltransferase
MANVFGGAAMAAGYARSRPAVHPVMLARALSSIGRARFGVGLDVGCGSGVSTRALLSLCERAIGVEPAVAMTPHARATAAGAAIVAAGAERLPLAGDCIDLITAAGALNYTEVASALDECRRVLRPGGVMVVYDFSPGRRMRASSALRAWFDEFTARWPWPPHHAVALDVEKLHGMARGFEFLGGQTEEIGLTIEPDFYVDYMMTETNVAHAIEAGAPADGIRAWIAETSGAVFGGAPREVLFDGYWVGLARR